nr:Titin like [Ipomoea batatas]
MELRRCSNLYFINTIRDGLVVKVCNVNSHGKPALVFKALKDIYETEDTKGSKAFTSLNSPEKYADSVCGITSVKGESQSLPVADRTLREIDTENNEIVCCGSDDKDDDSDSNDYIFAKMTLKQLKERCKSKKRKLPSRCDASPEQEDVNSQQEEDEDLKVPLRVFKTKFSKNSKAKRKRTNSSMFPCSKTSISVKTEQIMDSDVTVQFKGDSASLTTVKAEVTEHEFSSCPSTSSLASFPSEVPVLSDVDLLPLAELEAQAHKPEFSANQSTNSFTDCSSINCHEEFSCSGLISTEVTEHEFSSCPSTSSLASFPSEVPVLSDVNLLPLAELEAQAHKPEFSANQSTHSFTDCSSINCHEEFSSSGLISTEVPETIEVQGNGPMLFAEEQQCCTLNDVSTNDNMECVEPHPHGGPLEIVLPSRDKNLDLHLNQHVISGQNSCNFESCISDATITGKVDSADIHHAGDIYMPEDETKEEFCSTEQNVSTTRPLENIFSSGGSKINSSTYDDLISVKASPSSLNRLSNDSSADTTNSCLNHGALESESSKVDGKKSPCTIEEKSSTMKSQYSNVASLVSTSELQRTPERFPSMRKAISPSSQAGLCQAMTSADLFDEAENYKCKEKLLVGTGVVSCGKDENSELSPPVRQPKVIIKRKDIAKRLKIIQKGSPNKGNSDTPQFSRSLPQLSTGCTSIDSCSESAIAFSQRQMHDFESLAMKLMDELKSMKEMVEEKLLFEAYRNAYLKNEADEVRNALNNTKKVEETAKKWLSLMTRDCTRFCKIMELRKLNQNCGPSSSGTAQKERKITFADEAGGMLCSVNYFDDAVTSPMPPCGENQEC